ncbi:bidirectional sugar transporter SWEET15-like [Primulina tabacum]|uniref:bidirectional sugar transporter SWEET15-like n=1 Tax=Primulina tabacum TaxID=48773 RepID=UPI003F5A051F
MAVFGDQPAAITFGILGNIVSVLVYFAPLPTFVRIYKEKSTLGFQSVPYNVAFFSAMLWLYYAFLKKNVPLLISINSFGCLIETFYIVSYLWFASRKARIDTTKLFCLMNLVLFPVMFGTTFFLFKEPERAQVVGWICVAVSVSVFAAPLSIVFQVVRTRSVEYMPFPLSFFLTLSAIMWFAYGLFQRDLCVALPNVIGFFLGALQMVLYGLFRKPTRGSIDDVEKEKLPEHALSMIVLGTPEVHPIDSKNLGDEMIHVENLKDEEAADPQDNFVTCALSVEPSPVNPQKDSIVVEVCAA